ncbi:MAG TPA: hypothetical protein VMG08_07800 [Allosphingosinicella sp.]|nr:hypothetical protein [Allosphingosinicella sp.]
MLSPLLFAAAVLAGAPALPPAPVEEEEIRRPAVEDGKGGPYAPVEEVAVIVEGEPVEAPRAFTIAPDPALERRYAPRARAPLNRVTIPF